MEYLIKREYAIFSNKNNVGERLNIYLGSNVARRVGKDNRLVKDQYQLSCYKQEFFISAYDVYNVMSIRAILCTKVFEWLNKYKIL
jgi:hypothetical protein